MYPCFIKRDDQGINHVYHTVLITFPRFCNRGAKVVCQEVRGVKLFNEKKKKRKKVQKRLIGYNLWKDSNNGEQTFSVGQSKIHIRRAAGVRLMDF